MLAASIRARALPLCATLGTPRRTLDFLRPHILSHSKALLNPSLSHRRTTFRLYATSSPPSRNASASPPRSTHRQPLLSRFLPTLFTSSSLKDHSSTSSFKKIVSLARPERRPLLIAVGLLLVSSSVSLSIPFTVGKLIDFFTSSNPVRVSCLVSV